MKVQGGCLCGGIRYEISGPLTDVGNCHCSMCRRFHGAAFATYAKVDAEHFRWLSGQDLLTVYETSPGIGWAFCRICGSSLGVPAQGKLGDIALGPLDSDPGVRPTEHIFVGSKAAWFQITDTMPQHEEWPVHLAQPRSEADWSEARRLVEEYAASLGVDLSFQDLAGELQHLDQEYAPPLGAFLLASENAIHLGCVGLRQFSEGVGEIKRLYIRPTARGRGLGRLLAKAAVDCGRRLGYRRLLLDTLPSMSEAHALYASLGFKPTDAYRFNPVPGTAYLALDLPGSSHVP